ncbi:MAG: hypothetical protein QOH54_2960 [Mycobacterium sp.]|jgi:uncharacterized protein YbjT (DUF2867 family)|nr:hypothetical protein [Mycobacterium sp.]
MPRASACQVKAIVFGATGQIDRLVVAKLLDGGHDTTVYVRNPGKLQDVDQRLTVVTE